MSLQLRGTHVSTRLLTAMACAVFLAGPPGQAQTDDPSPEPPQSGGAIDEIVVTGQRSLRLLRREAGQATENFYTLLNQVLDHDDYRITCRNETATGSRISRRVCRAAFQERELQRQARATFDGIETDDDGHMSFDGPMYDPTAALLHKQREFADALMEAVNADPDLNRAARELIALQRTIEEMEGRGGRN
jgi:hypothetical protein